MPAASSADIRHLDEAVGSADVLGDEHSIEEEERATECARRAPAADGQGADERSKRHEE